MADPVAVLLVPADGDPGGLLAPGRCGPAPAVAHRWNINGHSTPWEGRPGDGERALTLWWDGALVPEGWDRARRVVWGSASDALADVVEHRLFAPSVGVVIVAADRLVRASFASRVVLLDRLDGRLVERP